MKAFLLLVVVLGFQLANAQIVTPDDRYNALSREFENVMERYYQLELLVIGLCSGRQSFPSSSLATLNPRTLFGQSRSLSQRFWDYLDPTNAARGERNRYLEKATNERRQVLGEITTRVGLATRDIFSCGAWLQAVNTEYVYLRLELIAVWEELYVLSFKK